MNVGAFVCSCDNTCSLDLNAVRDGVDDVDVVASSSLLCEDGLAGMSQLVAEHELDQLIVTACDDRCERRFRAVAEENGLHPDATAVVDHREGAGWVHGERAATAKTARLINARLAGLEEEALSRTVSREASDPAVSSTAATPRSRWCSVTSIPAAMSASPIVISFVRVEFNTGAPVGHRPCVEWSYLPVTGR